MKLDEYAYRKYADDILQKKPHEIDFEKTVVNLEKLFDDADSLNRQQYECLRINYVPLTAIYVPYRDYANMIKRMDENARLKELDYTALKTLQFVARLRDSSLLEVRLTMLRRLDRHTADAPLTIEDLVGECENFTALTRDNTDMEESHGVHVVQKKMRIASIVEDRTTEAHACFSPPTLGRRCDRNREDDPTVTREASARTLSPSPLRTLESTSMSMSEVKGMSDARYRYHVGITSNVEETRISTFGTLYHVSQDGRWITDED
ncbi:hypothetical protein RB195_022775 [Necator americanus]|uniref:Uncharacterized protein n=1 Tax=Necator americanus TaxID=51031 RepID=A0ABR1EGT6_NECAM